MATVNKDFRVKNGLVVEGSTATVNGNNVVTDADTTDILDEGATNLYYTEQRVIDVLTGSTQTNISITEYDGDLIITAENGVDDSDTDDLAEGATNLYFTDQRAVDAVIDGAVDTDDIEEGATNLYFTDTRVYEKVDNIITAGTGITVTPDAMAETITIDVDTDEIATKQYVDTVAEGLHIHASVNVATDEPLADTTSNTVTYNNSTGTLTLSTALTTLDSVTLTNGMRVLVKNEGDAGGAGATANGIYTWATGGTVLTRALDFNTQEEIAGGDFTFVTSGTKYNNTGWVQTEPVATLGSDQILWSQFSGAGTFTGGTGIDIDGEEISIDFTEFDTDDIDEGTTNLYHTDQRVIDVLTGSTQTNISITEYDGDLIITAENGVDDSDTDDLDEGATNLYFTDERAVDALVGQDVAVGTIEINSIAKTVAFNTLVESTTAPEAVATFNKTEHRSAKYLVKMSTATHTHLSEVLVTLDSSDNIAMTEYAIVTSNGSLGDLTADVSGNDIRLIADVANANTIVKVFGTLVE